MAEAMFKEMIGSRGIASQWQARSAGTWGKDGYPAHPHAVQALRRRGIYLPGHRSRIITQAIIDSADLILTMERDHKEALHAEFPAKRQSIYMLSETVGKRSDVADPVQKPPAYFEKTASTIQEILESGFEEILRMAQPISDIFAR